MKKFLLYASAVSAMMLAGSCQKEAVEPVYEGEATVTFALELPNKVETKAMSQAEATNIVYYEIWNSDWSRQLYPVDSDALASQPVSGKQAQIEMKLVANQTYNFIFWAQNDSHNAYDVNELKNVKVNYDAITGNDDKFDAFYATRQIRVTGPVNETITLYRPFAQLNFGADVMETDLGPINVTGTTVKVTNLATVFNTIEGVGQVDGNAATATFTATGLATDEALVTGGKSYTWVTMDYMLMMNEQSLVDVDAAFGIDNMDDLVVRSVTNVPLKKNHRTNIVGDLFSIDATLNIIVEPAFDQSDIIVTDESVKLDDGSYLARSAAEFEYALENVEAGKTIYLADGVYEGVFLMNKSCDVNIEAANEGQATISGKLGVAYGNVTLKGLNFKVSANTSGATANSLVNKAGAYVIPIYCADLTVENCTFEGMTDSEGAIYYYANTGSALVPEKLTVKNCSFDGDRAIRARANVEVTGCTFTSLANPCLQILGIGETPGYVTFTGNTSDNVVNGVTIKTSNHVAKNITFNVGGNTNCNTIAYDLKKPGNVYAETFTYTGEVTDIVPEP